MANKKKRLFIGWSERPFSCLRSHNVLPLFTSEGLVLEKIQSVCTKEGLLMQTDGVNIMLLCDIFPIQESPETKDVLNSNWTLLVQSKHGQFLQSVSFLFFAPNNPCEENVKRMLLIG